jgi:hypothetical protein
MLWFWAVREAIQRMNFIPVKVPTSEAAAEGDSSKPSLRPMSHSTKSNPTFAFSFHSERSAVVTDRL